MSFLGGLFGGGSSAPKINYQPSGISSHTGFSVSPSGNVSESPTLSSNIGSLQSTFGAASNAFGALGATVKPGFSQFRQAGLADISNTFMGRRSNLQDTLAQRRVLGSSFGNSQFNQLAADQASTQANFEADSYLKELAASTELTQQQYNAATQQFAVAINQSNIEANVAAGLVASNNQAAAKVATAQAELDAQAQQGAGALAGLGLGLGAKWASTGFAGPGGASLGSLLSGAAALA